ncbi:MAG: GNAT family N-acetyltransferase [Paracoccaceae bacterium]|uniref:GNAT family N-acetyltransferase n=1 Tax=Candidatus Salinivivens marinus TaxID=3381703 RepID=UPI000BE03E2A|nr:MAG: GNAT family N-acetyltransferase [Rhodobacteraceae bacterium MED-G08]
MPKSEITIKIVETLLSVNENDWDACAASEEIDGMRPVDPFTTYRFLRALEDSGSVGNSSGWHPYYILAFRENELLGCAPMYIKTHSQGEYIFDHAWANAYERAGGNYYPKIQVAVPFTPVPGKRLLAKKENQEKAFPILLEGIKNFASKNKLSSAHITFCSFDEFKKGESLGFLKRTSSQFHWSNDNYKNFQDFLNALSSRKRKNIRKEREKARNFGGKIVRYSGKEITGKHWDAFWDFYQDTGRRKWGQPYLTRSFFDIASEKMSNELLLVLAEIDGTPIAGALNFIGMDALYGRYWGCTENYSNLHFEICYYQAIEYAIENCLSRVEAGAQGDHKLARGYMPSHTYSLHWINDSGFSKAVAQYLDEERRAVGREMEILSDYGPFKDLNLEERE